jgi:hypothetical protein
MGLKNASADQQPRPIFLLEIGLLLFSMSYAVYFPLLTELLFTSFCREMDNECKEVGSHRSVLFPSYLFLHL